METPTSLDSEFERLSLSSPIATRPSWRQMAANEAIVNTQPERPKIITLDVAGRHFKVSSDIVTAESGLFKRQLSAQCNWVPQRDGTYFIDTNPALFEHLLDFMRRPSVFPLFWSQNKGFDYNLYQRLQAEAEYFQISTLDKWIKEKKYHQAVTIRTYEPVTRELKNMPQERIAGNMTKDWYYVSKVHKTYVCPRRIHCHYGKREACGRACHEHKGDGDTDYDEEEYLKVVAVKREIVFDEEVCKVR
jgi:hypothetical protein